MPEVDNLSVVPPSLKNETGQDWFHCEMFYPFRDNQSYGDHLRLYFSPVPSPSQGWFLCYLFVFSQIFAGLFVLVHPSHQDDAKFLCFKKPISKALQVLCCVNFFGYLTPTHDKFVKAVKFWLGHPAKLALVPSILIGIVEALLRPTFPDGRLWFFSVFMDLCNDLNYIIIFVIGFGITAADEHGMKEVIKRGRWFNLIIGTVINMFFSFNFLPIPLPHPGPLIVKGFLRFLRGFAEWMFIIGVYGVTRELVTKPYTWLPPLSQLAMPFYLSHQQVLIMIAAGASWYPHLRSFPVVLILSTIGTLLVSWGITKAGPVRYFFGLPTSDSSVLPGKAMGGYLPQTVMSVLFAIACVLVNVL